MSGSHEGVGHIRLALLHAGYLPLPCAGKRPVLEEWPNVRANDEMIARWSTDYATARNTGVLAANTPGADIDVRDAKVADEIEAMIRRTINGGVALLRVGLAPKRLIPFRASTPFAKMVTPVFVSPDGAEHKVEILGAGQQYVVDGIHPDTHRPYEWNGTALWDVPRASLPELTPAMAADIIAQATAILERTGWRIKVPATKPKPKASTGPKRTGEASQLSQQLADRIEDLCATLLPNGRRDGAEWEVGSLGGELGQSLRVHLTGDKAGVWSDFATGDAGDALDLVAQVKGLDIVGAMDSARAFLGQPAFRPSALPKDTRKQADDGQPEPPVGVMLDDLHAYMPQHNYIFAPTRDMWPGSSVNARVAPIPILDKDGKPALGDDGKPKTLKASAWLDRHKSVEQMTWAPGLPMLIRDRLIADGGWIERSGVTTFNLYRPPIRKLGDASKAGKWSDHVKCVFGDDAAHIIFWLAHRVQRPHEKINHALVLGGAQGIGKDTLLEPVKLAIGAWNFLEVSPQQMLGRFNGHLKSVILRINEARDLGDLNRFTFYDHMKAVTAAPPDVLRVDEKNLREYSIPNVTGVIITTNHKSDGIFLPADDRRHFVAWSELTKDDFAPAYWNDLWGWYARGGLGHVTAYLAALDLASFDPKAPPPKSDAFWAIVDASRAPEDAELADVLDLLGNPAAVTLARITTHATGEFATWMLDRKNRRLIPHRMEQCGYVPVRNDSNKEGVWKVSGMRQVIYAKAELSIRDRIAAARWLTEAGQ